MLQLWQKVERKEGQGQWAGLYVTLNTDGWIVMNRTTHVKLGSPPYFRLYFDRVNSRIGLKPYNGGRDAYPARKIGRHGGRKVAAFRMLKDCGIDLPQTVRFHDARLDHEGMLILDLRTARICPRSASRKRRLGAKPRFTTPLLVETLGDVPVPEEERQ